MFDIQRFSDEENQSAENKVEQTPIPEDFAGISEEVARDVMQKYAEQNPTSAEEKDEFDKEGNYTGDKDVADVNIPYSRFKETLDKQKEFEKQLKAYQEKFGEINAPTKAAQSVENASAFPQNNLSIGNYQEQAKQPPEPKYFSADDAKKIDEDVEKLTMQITGMTQEDVESLDYLDDDDPKIAVWNHAKGLARIATYNRIIAEQQQQAQEEYRRSILLNQSANNFNDYVNRQKAAENFEAYQQFATNDFFNSQSPVEKQILIEANARLENHQATPTDFIVVRDYFTRAKAAFDAKQGKPTKKESPKPQFPRTDKVNGLAGSGGSISAASLAEMMKITSWDKIPQQYKDILLNSTT